MSWKEPESNLPHCTEKGSDLPKATQLVSSRSRSWGHLPSRPSLCHYSHMPASMVCPPVECRTKPRQQLRSIGLLTSGSSASRGSPCVPTPSRFAYFLLKTAQGWSKNPYSGPELISTNPSEESPTFNKGEQCLAGSGKSLIQELVLGRVWCQRA